MKRLKFLHPFGGKPFAGLIVMYSTLFGLAAGICLAIHFLEMRYLLWSALAPFLISVLVMLLVCNVRQKKDKEAIACAQKAEWKPIPEELIYIIRMQLDDRTALQSKKREAIRSGILLLVFAGFLVLNALTDDTFNPPSAEDWHAIRTSPFLPVMLAAAGIILFYVLFCIIRRRIWLHIDESAVYADIPIDSIYEVTYYEKRGVQRTKQYLVFYQPDGKYIVPAPEGSSEGGMITVIRFHGLLRCMAFPFSHKG